MNTYTVEVVVSVSVVAIAPEDAYDIARNVLAQQGVTVHPFSAYIEVAR